LTSDYVIQFTALDPSTGAVVGGVSVSNASLLVDNLGGGDLTVEVDELAPLWLAIPNSSLESGNGG
jgi:hypothetical protein